MILLKPVMILLGNWGVGPVIKPDKKLTMTSCQQIISSSAFFLFMADSEQSRSRIPSAWSAVLKFLLKATFYLTKTENRTKKSLTQLPYCCFE